MPNSKFALLARGHGENDPRAVCFRASIGHVTTKGKMHPKYAEDFRLLLHYLQVRRNLYHPATPERANLTAYLWQLRALPAPYIIWFSPQMWDEWLSPSLRPRTTREILGPVDRRLFSMYQRILKYGEYVPPEMRTPAWHKIPPPQAQRIKRGRGRPRNEERALIHQAARDAGITLETVRLGRRAVITPRA